MTLCPRQRQVFRLNDTNWPVKAVPTFLCNLFIDAQSRDGVRGSALPYTE